MDNAVSGRTIVHVCYNTLFVFSFINAILSLATHGLSVDTVESMMTMFEVDEVVVVVVVEERVDSDVSAIVCMVSVVISSTDV
jgi:hypothetical protein